MKLLMYFSFFLIIIFCAAFGFVIPSDFFPSLLWSFNKANVLFHLSCNNVLWVMTLIHNTPFLQHPKTKSWDKKWGGREGTNLLLFLFSWHYFLLLFFFFFLHLLLPYPWSWNWDASLSDIRSQVEVFEDTHYSQSHGGCEFEGIVVFLQRGE